MFQTIFCSKCNINCSKLYLVTNEILIGPSYIRFQIKYELFQTIYGSKKTVSFPIYLHFRMQFLNFFSLHIHLTPFFENINVKRFGY